MARWRSLPADLEPRTRELVIRLRELKDQVGFSAEALARKTQFSKSSWGRYLNGTTLPPRQAVEALTRLAGADPARTLALWELAEGAQPYRSKVAAVDTPAMDIPPMDILPGDIPAGDVDPPTPDGAATAVGDPAPTPVGASGSVDAPSSPDGSGSAGVPGSGAGRGGEPRRRRWWIGAAVAAAAVPIVGVAIWLITLSASGPAASSAPAGGYGCDFLRRDGHLYAGHSATADQLVALNSAGQDVVEVQCLLTHHGLDPGRIDGLFGQHTEAAVKAFQQRGGAVPDGMVGRQTWALLRS